MTENTICVPEIKINGNEKRKLDGTASQIRRILLLLPVAVGINIVDFEDPVWQFLLTLRSLCSTIFASALSFGQIALLQLQIDDYFHKRNEVFPNEKCVPKHEYLRHYPGFMHKLGPLKHLWTLPYESKHSIFKDDIRHLKNFKTITETLARRHQTKMATTPVTGESLVEAKIAILYIPDAYERYVREMIKRVFNNEVDSIKHIAKKVTFRGITYQKTMSVCVDKNEFGNFIVCRIEYIIINSTFTDIVFIGKEKEIFYNSNIVVYEIATNSVDETLSCFPYSSLLSPDILPEIVIADIPVYLPKYAPLDPDY